MRWFVGWPRASLFFFFGLLILCGCAGPAHMGEIDERSREVPAGSPEEIGSTDRRTEEDFGLPQTLQLHKHGTVYTDMDTYDVRNIRFVTGQGFGRSNALMGYYLNTRYEYEINYIDQLRVEGKVTPSEVMSVPHRYDMVEDQHLNYIFRTTLKMTNGERIEFIVRIDRISGELQEGGSFNLVDDELQTLKKIVFY